MATASGTSTIDVAEAVHLALSKFVRSAADRFGDAWLVSVSHSNAPVVRPEETEPFAAYGSGAESHPFTEICVCVDGAMCLRVTEDYLSLSGGMVAIIPPEYPHEERAVRGAGYECLWATADPYMAYLHHSGCTVMGEFYTREAVSVGPDTGFDIAVSELATLSAVESQYAEVLMKTHLLQFLVAAINGLSAPPLQCASLPPDTSLEVPRRSQIVVRTLNYIRRNYTRSVRLSEIATDLAMSESQLNARFKRECGETVMQHLEGYRILIAKKLLSCTESSIEQIASHLAFCDQFHFSKTFKKRTGVPPLQYRRCSTDGPPATPESQDS